MNGKRDRAPAVIGWRLQNLLLELVRDVSGDRAIERRARYDGDHLVHQVPVPLAGVWATEQLASRVRRELIFHVRRAREAGHSWDEIGQSLCLEATTERSRAEAAFERVASEPRSPLSWREPSFGWRCAGCDQMIWDRGPYDSIPADCEMGHAEDCSRLAARTNRRVSTWDDSHGLSHELRPRPTGGTGDEPRVEL